MTFSLTGFLVLLLVAAFMYALIFFKAKHYGLL